MFYVGTRTEKTHCVATKLLLRALVKHIVWPRNTYNVLYYSCRIATQWFSRAHVIAITWLCNTIAYFRTSLLFISFLFHLILNVKYSETVFKSKYLPNYMYIFCFRIIKLIPDLPFALKENNNVVNNIIMFEFYTRLVIRCLLVRMLSVWLLVKLTDKDWI
jgi:hypothetical protein